MPHHTPLIAMIVMGLVLAFGFGAIANRLRISPLVGYLLAGVLVGPFTPGFVGDQSLANELAEIGVILLMFGVGLHFSLKDLMSVKTIAIPGAVAQISVATLLGLGMGWALDWPVATGFIFGLALSTASTVVLLRAMQERRLIETTLEAAGGVQKRAAELLHIKPTTLNEMIKRYDIRPRRRRGSDDQPAA